MHKAIKKVSEDVEVLKFNTAIAALMSLINDIYATKAVNKSELITFLSLLYPFAPHIAEEIYEQCQFEGTVDQQSWPEFDESKCIENTIEIAIQVNGRVRSRINVSADIDKDSALELAKNDEKIANEIAGKSIIKEIYVPGKLINIVAK